MLNVLTAEQVDSYRRDGLLFPLPALSAAEVEYFRACHDELDQRLGGRPTAVEKGDRHLDIKWICDLATHPAVLDAVEDLIGPDILIHSSTIFTKYAHDEKFVSWHQDSHYWGLSEPRLVSAWVALTDSLPETGCVMALPGSHRLGQLPHTTHRAAANLLSNGQQAEMDVDAARAVPLVMRAGECSLHHTHLLHSSAPNRGRDRRIGVGISYIPTQVRHIGPRRLTASLVRGRDRHGHFDPEPRPRADFDAEARAVHAEACARFFGSHGSVRTEVVEA